MAARNVAHVGAPPERVFAVLAAPHTYEHWVVGAKKIRAADPGWPGLGTVFHHAVGIGPLTIRDHTQVIDVEPPRRLVLRTHARPLASGVVRFTIEPEGTGSRVEMVEGPGGRLTRRVWTPLHDVLVRRRNDESLRRLKELAEGRGPTGAAQ
jgi:uncharacterized protein YndB with AHSA1/START domain